MDTFIANFHFLRPWMLLAWLPLLLILYKLKQKQSSLSAWQKVCDPALLAYLKVGDTKPSSQQSYWLALLASLLIVIALAGPVWKKMPQPMYQEQSALIVLLDLSRSMDAADIKPNRLVRAKQKLTDLLRLRKEGQTALVVFAGSAFVVTPLTEDSETILSQLQGLSTDIMPAQGGQIDVALHKAAALFAQAGVLHGQALLLTDSDAFSDAAVQQFTHAGHRLSVIGVGTAAGAPIAQPRGGFLTDNRGNIIIPKLDISRLKTLASLGHGTYHDLTLNNADIQPLLHDTQAQMFNTDKAGKSDQTSDQWFEEGPWLLLVLLLLVLPGFRRGLLVVGLCLVIQTKPAEANSWSDLWQTPNQQGQALMTQKNYAQAEKTFTNPAWKASAAYKNKDYETALKNLSAIKEPTADDMYNQGNALAQLGHLDEAIAAYDKALQQDPKHQDALANKQLVEKLKQEQEKKQQDKDKSEQQKKNQDQQDSKQDNKQQDKNKSEQDQSGKPQKDQGQQNAEQQQDKQNQQGSPSQDKQQSEQQQKSESAQQQENQTPSAQQNAAEKEQQAAAQQEKDKKQAEQAQKDHQKAAQQANKQAQEQKKEAQTQQVPSDEDLQQAEEQHALEQTLRRIPDDPGGLLRRKFKYQYQQQSGNQNSGVQQW